MASQSTKIAGLPFIPKKYSVVERGGKAYVTTKGRKKYKTPARVRKKMAAAARRAKVPLLTGAAVGLPVGIAFNDAMRERGLTRLTKFGANLLSFYTGVFISPTAGVSFEAKRLLYGLVPALAVFGINKTGILKPVNQKLAKMKIPLRLS